MHRIDPMKRERATAVLVDFCHTKLRFQEKKIFWALPWENLRLLMWPKNPISSYFSQNSEMQNCQDYTDPTVCILYYCEYVICKCPVFSDRYRIMVSASRTNKH